MFKNKSLTVCRTFIYIYTVIQCIFALIWMIGNLTVYYPEKLSMNYIEAAETLIVDDYMGILYALFLKIVMLFTEGTGAVHAGVSILQVMMVFAAFVYASKVFGGKSITNLDRFVISAFITTSPMVMHACFSILPNAFFLALTTLFISELRVCIDKPSVKSSVLVVLAFAISFLLSDYAIIMLALTVPVILYLLIHKNITALRYVGVAVIVLIVGIGVSSYNTTTESYGRTERSMALYFHQRIVWPELETINEYYQEAGIDENHYNNAVNVSERLFEEYAGSLRHYYGKESSDNILVETARTYLHTHKYGVAKNIIKDITFNFAPGIAVLYISVQNTAETSLPMLYVRFVRKMPFASKVLFYGFCFANIVVVIMGIVEFVRNKFRINYRRLLYTAFIMTSVALYYSMFWFRGFDYRNALPALSFPLLFTLLFCFYKKD